MPRVIIRLARSTQPAARLTRFPLVLLVLSLFAAPVRAGGQAAAVDRTEASSPP